MALALVRSSSPHRRMEWWADDAVSVRVYEWTAAREGAFCAAETTAFYAILEGELEVTFGPSLQRVRAVEGEACLVVGGTPHVYRVAAGSRFVAADFAERSEPGVRQAALSADEGRAFVRAFETRAPEALGAAFSTALEVASRARSVALVPTHSTRRLLEVRRRLDAGLSGPLSLGEVARDFRMHPEYLSRAFRANFGGTPTEYVRLIRMERFLRSLRGATSMTQAAAAAGFGDYPTLCRLTAAWFGAPPSRLVVRTARAA